MNHTISRQASAASQRGLTVIELTISLTVAAVLMVGSYFGYQMIHSAQGQNEVRLLTQAGNCARNAYANQASFAGVTAASLINAGCFTDANIVRGAEGVAPTLVDGTGHAVAVSLALGPGGENTALAFTVTGNFNTAVCTQTMRGLLPSASVLTVGGNDVRTLAGVVTPAAIDTGCAVDPNTFTYTVTK